MTLFSECMPSCVRKVLDIAEIVRGGFIANYKIFSTFKKLNAALERSELFLNH